MAAIGLCSTGVLYNTGNQRAHFVSFTASEVTSPFKVLVGYRCFDLFLCTIYVSIIFHKKNHKIFKELIKILKKSL